MIQIVTHTVSRSVHVHVQRNNSRAFLVSQNQMTDNLELAIYRHQQKLCHWKTITKFFLSAEEKQELIDFKKRANPVDEKVETIEELTLEKIEAEIESQSVICKNALQWLPSCSDENLEYLRNLYRITENKKRKRSDLNSSDLWLLTYRYIPGYYNRSGTWEPSRGVPVNGQKVTILLDKHPAKYIAKMNFKTEGGCPGERRDQFRHLCCVLHIPKGTITQEEENLLDESYT